MLHLGPKHSLACYRQGDPDHAALPALAVANNIHVNRRASG
jgi:hypothetical protein